MGTFSTSTPQARDSVHLTAFRCVRSHHRAASCTRCSEVCSANAIQLGDSVQINDAACDGCGLCTTVCPTGAFEACAPEDGELLEQVQEALRTSKSIVFACEKHFVRISESREVAVETSCIGRLNEFVLFGALSAGAQSVYLENGLCGRCARKNGQAVAAEAARQANLLSHIVGLAGSVSIAATLGFKDAPASEPPEESEPETVNESRRRFFSALRGGAGVAAQAIAPVAALAVLGKAAEAGADTKNSNVSGKPALVHEVPERRNEFLKLLRRKAQISQSKQFESSLWGSVNVSSDCSACGMCAQFCPTAALRKVESHGVLTIEFKASDCVQCGLCADVCNKVAGWNCVTLSRTTDLAEVTAESTKMLARRNAKDTIGIDISPEERLQDLLGTEYITS